jgi:hypothetical protein
VITAFVIAVLACGALAYVSVPLRSGAGTPPEESFEKQELESKKRVALTAILDIEDERDMGKLSGEDFAVLRSEYETEAVAALVELDTLRGESGAEPGDDLEAEIAAIRDRLAGARGHSSGGALLACPSCGAPRVPGRACKSCGA